MIVPGGAIYAICQELGIPANGAREFRRRSAIRSGLVLIRAGTPQRTGQGHICVRPRACPPARTGERVRWKSRRQLALHPVQTRIFTAGLLFQALRPVSSSFVLRR